MLWKAPSEGRTWLAILLQVNKIMSRSFTIHYDPPSNMENNQTLTLNNGSMSDTTSTTSNNPNYCTPGTTQPNCIGFTKRPSPATSQMMIYIYIGIGGVILIMTVVLLLNSSRVKKVKKSIASGNPEKVKMGISW